MKRVLLILSISVLLSSLSRASLVELRRMVALDKCEEVVALLKGPQSETINITELRVTSAKMLGVLYEGLGARILSDRSRDGMSILLISAQNGQVDHVEFLIQRGVSVNYKDDYGRTALYYASGNITAECTLSLIKAGAYVDSQNSEGITPLMFAVQEGNVDAVSILISAGANLRLKDGKNRTALDYTRLEHRMHYVSDDVANKIRAALETRRAEGVGVEPKGSRR